MDDILLQTKLQIPPPALHLVKRARLVEALEDGIDHYRLVLLAAPAGYGKTTLLAQWARASRIRPAWLSVSARDNDLELFLRYLAAGWEAARPGALQGRLALLLDATSPDTQAILSAFINRANQLPGPLAFVIDDYHLIEDPAIHTAMAFLLDHLPPNLSLVLATRGEPGFPLSRYRARQELLEFHAEDLKFQPEETADFMNRLMGLDLAHDQLDRLQDQLEGWIAGLQLTALTLRRRVSVSMKLALSGRQRFIADYLSHDVLSPLEDGMQRFMLQTSIPDRLCASLCQAITGIEDSREMLATLERENLFLLPLDDQREWYRYHHLFAEFLREELGRRYPEQIPELHRLAGSWHLEHNLPEQAFDHALEADDSQLAAQIIERYLPVKLMTGESRTVYGWLKAIPDDWRSAHPTFDLAEAFFLAFSGDFDSSQDCLERVEDRLRPPEGRESRRQLAKATACRCLIACLRNEAVEAETYARISLQDLGEEDVFFRAGIYHSLGDLYRQNGRWDDARQSYQQVLHFTSHPSASFRKAHIYGALADLDLRQGSLRAAAGYWRQALDAILEPESQGRIPLPVAGWVHIRMGEILYEWDELAQARDHLSRGLEQAEVGGDVRSLIAGYLNAGRMELTSGDLATAAAYLERTRPLIESARFSHWISRFERFQLELWLAQDKLHAAVDWSDRMLEDPAVGDRPEGDVTQLAMARALIVKGDAPSIRRALNLLERLHQAAQEEGRNRVRIEALALQALGQVKLNQLAAALTCLENALRLAEPEGYVRSFADLGLPMARLLQEARSRRVMPEYVDRLLAAYRDQSLGPAQTGLPEPLTNREQEIVELLAAGLTNRQIAEKLVISPETVKRHASNIYGKLGVGGRTEAAARARELDLLD